MIHYTYAAYNGQAVRDGDADQVMLNLIAAHNAAPTLIHSFMGATENTLNALRVHMRHGLIACDQIKLFFVPQHGVAGEQPRLYPSGGISPRPDGFCDFTDKWLMELL